MSLGTPRSNPDPGAMASPKTPVWMTSLSRELETAIAERNILTGKSRRKVLKDLQTTTQMQEDETLDRLRKKAVEELLQSEKSYLNHLNILQNFFMNPLNEMGILRQQDFVAIFGDIPSITQVNQELLSSLENSTDKIGKVFLEVAPYLKFYSTYAQDFQTSSQLVERLSLENKDFREFLDKQETRPEVQLKLNALLITPVQRIPRYKMLLEDVIKHTPPLHQDKNNLTEALKQIDAVAWHINDQLKEHENSLKMLDIQKSLVGNSPKLIVPGRKLIKHGHLMKVARSSTSAKQSRYFVLFSDMLMYCKVKIAGVNTLVLPKGNCLECCCTLPLKHMEIETLVGKGVFKVTCKDEELVLYSKEPGVSAEWVDVLIKTAEKHRKDSSSLRKESSKREPLKRPQILKMRRESLSQIMLHRSSQQQKKEDESRCSPMRLINYTLRDRTPKNSSKKIGDQNGAKKSAKRPVSAILMSELDTSPCSPRKKPNLMEKNDDMPPPISAVAMSSGSVRLRSKKIERPLLKSLSLTKKKPIEKRPSSMFASPSVYDHDEPRKRHGMTRKSGENNVMSSYLSGKFFPLTPSQKQTDISHLVHKDPSTTNTSGDDEMSNSAVEETDSGEPSQAMSYCTVM